MGGYLFATDITGDLEVGNFEQELDVSFGDIFENLDFGAMVLIEHMRGDWFFIFDGAYLSVETDNTASNRIASVNTNAEATQMVLEGFIGHRIYKDLDESNTLRNAFDVLAGARYNYVDVKVGASVNVLGLSAQRSLDADFDFIDPVVGVRFKHNFNKKWGSMLYADIGGFGVGSELTWQTAAVINYNFPGGYKIYGGVRYLHWDYEDDTRFGDLNWKADYTGPIIGFAKRF